MRRDPTALDRPFDMLVVGAGTHGACIARLAAMSGLAVALVDRGDFGAETSRNSAKLLHGGLRYVQHFDVPRIRESVDAQKAWFRFAPHLVRPLRFVIPTYGWGTRGPAALAAGIAAFHVIAADRNHGVAPAIRLPPSGVMSRKALLAAHPELDRPDVSGGAYWHDGQMLDAVRLTLECVHDAVAAGAVAVNHVECVELIHRDGGVVGAVLRDVIEGREFEVQASVVVNAAGPWVDSVLARGPSAVRHARSIGWTRNINLVTRRLCPSDVALGVASRRASDAAIGQSKRLFFMSPWQGCTIVGTTHELTAEHPDAITATDELVDGFIEEVNEALPGIDLKAADVHSVHLGMTPAEQEDWRRSKRSLVVDHQRTHGVKGLVSVAGIKYTTAPVIAARALSLVRSKLGTRASQAAFGRPAMGVPRTAARAGQGPGSVGSADDRELAWTRRIYGQRAEDCLASVPADDRVLTESDYVLHCRVLFGIEQEMVVRLTDAVLRATDHAERGRLTEAQLDWCAGALQAAHGWSDERRRAEVAATQAAFGRLRVRLSPA